MKLLLCKDCSDIIKLTKEERSCKCGKCKGAYTDDLNAYYTNGIPLGISNSSLVQAVNNQPEEGLGERFDAFVIPKECETYKYED